jgi:hypothetical protein
MQKLNEEDNKTIKDAETKKIRKRKDKQTKETHGYHKGVHICVDPR